MNFAVLSKGFQLYMNKVSTMNLSPSFNQVKQVLKLKDTNSTNGIEQGTHTNPKSFLKFLFPNLSFQCVPMLIHFYFLFSVCFSRYTVMDYRWKALLTKGSKSNTSQWFFKPNTLKSSPRWEFWGGWFFSSGYLPATNGG